MLLLLVSLLLQQGDRKGETQAPPSFPIPPSPALSAEDELKTFKLAPGFRIELVAAEPLIAAPVAFAWDPAGRLWVVEMRGYMPDVDAKGEADPVGRVSVLEDVDGDGKMDRATPFLEKLVLPRAIALVDGGVLVCEPPGLYFCRDLDGDLKCDTKEVVDPAYCGRGNPEHVANGLLRGVDNWIYSANTSKRYRRHDGQWLKAETRSRGQWGITQDDLGRLYTNSNSDFLRGDQMPCWRPEAHAGKVPGANVQVLKDQTVWPIRVNPGVNRGYQKGTLREDGRLARCTAACAPHVYRGEQFSEGGVFLCEPSGNLVKRVFLDEKGAARNAYDGAEFLASTDERFRPVQLATGPDGCLYVADLYRGILQHKAFVTSFLRKQILERALDKPLDQGRIWRVVQEGRPIPKPPPLAKTSDLVKALSHPNGWVRDTAQRLLVEKKDAAATPALKALAVGADPRAALHALFVLEARLDFDPAVFDKAPKELAALIEVLRTSTGPLSPLDALLAAATKDPAVPDEKLKDLELDLLERIMGSEDWEAEAPGRAALLAKIAKRTSTSPAKLAELLELIACQSTSALWRQRALLEPISTLKLPRSPALVKLAFAEDAKVRELARAAWPEHAKEPEPPRAAPLTNEERTLYERGRRQFAASCAACHQRSGLGMDGKAPPLVDSEWVLGSPDRLVRVVLNGLTGPIHVDGKLYGGFEMPAVLNMSTEEIAEALTFIRREWGHQAPAVSVETVRAIKRQVEDREEPWTEKELLKIR